VRYPEAEIRSLIKTDAAGKYIEDVSRPEIAQKITDLSQPADYARIKAPALAIYDVITPKSRLPYYWYLDKPQRQQYDRFLGNVLAGLTDARQRFRSGVKHARVIELEHSHHYVFIRDEAAVVREVRKFLLEK
jgi:hypothetical protein